MRIYVHVGGYMYALFAGYIHSLCAFCRDVMIYNSIRDGVYGNDCAGLGSVGK